VTFLCFLYLYGLVTYKLNNCIAGVVDRVLNSIVVDRGFESRSDEAKDY
jgi:hypothetical protein